MPIYTSMRKEYWGEKIKRQRKKAKLTAEDLLKRLYIISNGKIDYTTSAIYAWECGKNLLPEHIVPFLARIFDCQPEDIHHGYSPPNKTTSEQEVVYVSSKLLGTMTRECRMYRGARLKEARRAYSGQKMTADKLAKRLKVISRGRISVTTSAVYTWECGKNLLEDKTAIMIARTLKYSPEKLLGPFPSPYICNGKFYEWDSLEGVTREDVARYGTIAIIHHPAGGRLVGPVEEFAIDLEPCSYE